MTDKPMKNGRNYVDSRFVHDMMVTATMLSTMLYVNHAELRTLGRCSHVVAVLFSILDHIKKDGPMFFLKPCASREFSRNKGKKRNKNPRRVSITKYQNKRKQSAAPVIYLDP